MKKLLIAEDEEILLDVLTDTFNDAGWDVTTVMDGDAAIEAIDKEKYNLVLLDLLMPKKDGFEVLKYVKKNKKHKDLPIIVLSNLGVQEDINNALSLGARDYYVKTHYPMSEIVKKANQYKGE